MTLNITRKAYIVSAMALIVTFLMWSQNNISYKITARTSKLQFGPNSNLKSILVWTLPSKDPIMNLKEGQEAFIARNCSYINCYVSPNRDFFDDIKKFDVIVFHAPDISAGDLPKSRSPEQKYIFASMESSDYYPVCNVEFNDFFNWTWTYKLKSDEKYGYISIWNKEGEIIGPKEVMHWPKVEEMKPIDDVLKKKLSKKRFAAAWFVSNCKTPSNREIRAKKLKAALQKYKLKLDIYGGCGIKRCPRYRMSKCLEQLETDYYFYLSFENSMSEDYVTEKLLHALQHYAVPIVYGGANYTRFMPDGIYLDADKLTINQLASKMAEIIKDKEKYYSYFRWHNHYSYQAPTDSYLTDPYCNLCAMINDQDRFEQTTRYYDFNQWWGPNDEC